MENYFELNTKKEKLKHTCQTFDLANRIHFFVGNPLNFEKSKHHLIHLDLAENKNRNYNKAIENYF